TLSARRRWNHREFIAASDRSSDSATCGLGVVAATAVPENAAGTLTFRQCVSVNPLSRPAADDCNAAIPGATVLSTSRDGRLKSSSCLVLMFDKLREYKTFKNEQDVHAPIGCRVGALRPAGLLSDTPTRAADAYLSQPNVRRESDGLTARVNCSAGSRLVHEFLTYVEANEPTSSEELVKFHMQFPEQPLPMPGSALVFSDKMYHGGEGRASGWFRARCGSTLKAFGEGRQGVSYKFEVRGGETAVQDPLGPSVEDDVGTPRHFAYDTARTFVDRLLFVGAGSVLPHDHGAWWEVDELVAAVEPLLGLLAPPVQQQYVRPQLEGLPAALSANWSATSIYGGGPRDSEGSSCKAVLYRGRGCLPQGAGEKMPEIPFEGFFKRVTGQRTTSLYFLRKSKELPASTSCGVAVAGRLRYLSVMRGGKKLLEATVTGNVTPWQGGRDAAGKTNLRCYAIGRCCRPPTKVLDVEVVLPVVSTPVVSTPYLKRFSSKSPLNCSSMDWPKPLWGVRPQANSRFALTRTLQQKLPAAPSAPPASARRAASAAFGRLPRHLRRLHPLAAPLPPPSAARRAVAPPPSARRAAYAAAATSAPSAPPPAAFGRPARHPRRLHPLAVPPTPPSAARRAIRAASIRSPPPTPPPATSAPSPPPPATSAPSPPPSAACRAVSKHNSSWCFPAARPTALEEPTASLLATAYTETLLHAYTDLAREEARLLVGKDQLWTKSSMSLSLPGPAPPVSGLVRPARIQIALLTVVEGGVAALLKIPPKVGERLPPGTLIQERVDNLPMAHELCPLRRGQPNRLRANPRVLRGTGSGWSTNAASPTASAWPAAHDFTGKARMKAAGGCRHYAAVLPGASSSCRASRGVPSTRHLPA
ncbi:MAG: hypothetical protein BJ554DRAFT_2733, partial [Olpidium bornovanus]